MLIRSVRSTVSSAFGLVGKVASATYYAIYSALFVKHRVVPEVQKLINPSVKRKTVHKKRAANKNGLTGRKPGRPSGNATGINLEPVKRKPGRPRKIKPKNI